MLKNLGQKALKEVVMLCQDIVSTGKMARGLPTNYPGIPLRKKANAVRCEEYCTISL